MADKKNKNAKGQSSSTIAQNRKARHDYFIVERFEAGIVLQGWEVKSLREGRANISDAYVIVKDGELFLLGSIITPLSMACAYVVCDPQRTRKLLLHEKEIARLIGSVKRKGHTIVPLAFYWKGRHIKCEIALVEGKKEYDKRESLKQDDWQREKARIMKKSLR